MINIRFKTGTGTGGTGGGTDNISFVKGLNIICHIVKRKQLQKLLSRNEARFVISEISEWCLKPIYIYKGCHRTQYQAKTVRYYWQYLP